MLPEGGEDDVYINQIQSTFSSLQQFPIVSETKIRSITLLTNYESRRPRHSSSKPEPSDVPFD